MLFIHVVKTRTTSKETMIALLHSILMDHQSCNDQKADVNCDLYVFSYSGSRLMDTINARSFLLVRAYVTILVSSIVHQILRVCTVNA
jgi:hypothetical protein